MQTPNVSNYIGRRAVATYESFKHKPVATCSNFLTGAGKKVENISIQGAGAMGTAIIRGLIESGKAQASQIVVYDLSTSRLNQVVSEFGVRPVSEPAHLINADTAILLLAVKPQNMAEALASLKNSISSRLIMISIAAGVHSTFFTSILGDNIRLIRSMPNAAAMVGKSATAICAAAMASEDDMKVAEDFFSAIGEVVIVNEKLMNAVTALSGSGPGYLFTIMEALSDAGVLAGLSRDVSRKLAVQTVVGSAAMALNKDLSFSNLKDSITSPGGTTISGLRVMERAGVRGILMDAVEAAKKRADELMN